MKMHNCKTQAWTGTRLGWSLTRLARHTIQFRQLFAAAEQAHPAALCSSAANVFFRVSVFSCAPFSFANLLSAPHICVLLFEAHPCQHPASELVRHFRQS